MTKIDRVWEYLKSNTEILPIEAADYADCSVQFAGRMLKAWADGGFCKVRLDHVVGKGVGRSTPNKSYYKRVKNMDDNPPIVANVKNGSAATSQNGAMTPEEFATIRNQRGLSLVDFGRALGWTGSVPTLNRGIRRMELGSAIINEKNAKAARAL